VIDFHCHLDLYPDPHGSAALCRESGDYILSVTTTPRAWHGTLKLAIDAPRVRTALGFHPQLAHARHTEVPLFEALLGEARYVGEIGLDGGAEYRAHLEVQTRCFERILTACARAGGRVMTIHSRGAADEVLDAVEQHPGAGIAVLHWFSGTRKQLDRAVALGCWFSVGPAMVRGVKGRQLLASMPRNRVLTETDGPFGKGVDGPLMPGQVGPAVAACGAVWRIDPTEAQGQLDLNLRTIGGLADAPLAPSAAREARAPSVMAATRSAARSPGE
jgi:TatD DNase family protein